MIVSLDLTVFVILLLTALLALRVRELLTVVALLADYSLFAADLFSWCSPVTGSIIQNRYSVAMPSCTSGCSGPTSRSICSWSIGSPG